MRIVARLKRGSLFRLLFYAGARRAPHASRALRLLPLPPPPPPPPPALLALVTLRSLTSQVHARSHSTTHPISRDRPLEKQFDLAARAAATGRHPSNPPPSPPSSSPRPFLSLSRPAQASDFLPEFDDFAMCPLSRACAYRKRKLRQARGEHGFCQLPIGKRRKHRGHIRVTGVSGARNLIKSYDN